MGDPHVLLASLMGVPIPVITMVVLVIRRIVLTLDVMTEDISLDIIDMVIGTETLVDMAVVL